METRNFIAGEWVDGATTVPNVNPSDVTDVVGEFAQADAAQLDEAVAAAERATTAWRAVGLEQRQGLLETVGRELMARCEELGRLLSREEGKPFVEGKGEVFRAGQFFTYYAAEVLRQLGENAASVRPGVEIDVRREPMGVVAVISPWNFPMATAAWKIAPALAFGNAVVWKPANLTPASAVALTDIVRRAGFPDGVFQLVMGAGGTIGERLAAHPAVRAVTFTGSHGVGCRVAAAAATHLAKVQLELGSKNALVVMDDADVEAAVAAAVVGAFSGSGQKCTASSRLLVHRKVHDEFVDRLTTATTAMVVGHALEEGTQVGPVVSEGQLREDLDWLGRARETEGVSVACGGERLSLAHEGFYLSPAVLLGTTNGMAFNRVEMFAPIAAVCRVDSYEEGLAVANDTDYGLVAGIFTRSLARAAHFRAHAETGCVMVNLPTAGTDYHVPFGGRKASSLGSREQGRAAVEFFTQMKTAYVRAGEAV